MCVLTFEKLRVSTTNSTFNFIFLFFYYFFLLCVLTFENLRASTNNSTFNFAKMSACAPSSEPTHARVAQGVREGVRETGRQLEKGGGHDS